MNKKQAKKQTTTKEKAEIPDYDYPKPRKPVLDFGTTVAYSGKDFCVLLDRYGKAYAVLISNEGYLNVEAL